MSITLNMLERGVTDSIFISVKFRMKAIFKFEYQRNNRCMLQL